MLWFVGARYNPVIPVTPDAFNPMELIGIALSVLFFVIGYRDTIGAKKERIRTANAELERVQLRRLVTRGTPDSTPELLRIIAAKAKVSRVRTGDLISSEELLNALLMRVVESDLISDDRREELVKALTAPAQPDAELARDELVAFGAKEHPAQRERTLIAGLALLTTAAGVAVSFYLTRGDLPLGDLTREALTAFAASLVAVLIAAVFAVARDRDGSSPDGTVGKKQVDLEREVFDHLASLGVQPMLQRTGPDFDIVTQVDRQKVVIRTKIWPRKVSPSLVLDSLERLKDKVRMVGATRAILVTDADLEPLRSVMEAEGPVQIMSLAQFKTRLVRGGS